MSLIGYAWCLGKAVPVYNDAGLVNDPEYARFYFSELPSFSAADYPYITISFDYRLLSFTEEDYLSIMSEGSFETIDDFPFLSLLNRTDSPGVAPYGFNWIGSNDSRAYAICALTDTSPGPDGAEYFDTYLTGSKGSTGLYTEYISNAIRFSGQEDFKLYERVGDTIKCDRNGTKLTVTNIGDYLVLTETNKRDEQTKSPFCLRSWLTGFALGLAGKSYPYSVPDFDEEDSTVFEVDALWATTLPTTATLYLVDDETYIDDDTAITYQVGESGLKLKLKGSHLIVET